MSYLYCISDDFLTDISFQISEKILPGISVFINGKRYLSSGDKHFPWTKIKAIPGGEIEKKVTLLNPKTLEMIHWMCTFYFASIRKVLPLWLPYPLDMIAIQTKKHKQRVHGQKMIVIPDIWTSFSTQLNQKYNTLHSASTKKQRLEAWKRMKYGEDSTVLTTGSQVFLEFTQLEQIIVVDGRQRYYKNQQDPRYHISEIVDKMVEIYSSSRLNKYSYQDLTL